MLFDVRPERPINDSNHDVIALFMQYKSCESYIDYDMMKITNRSRSRTNSANSITTKNFIRLDLANVKCRKHNDAHVIINIYVTEVENLSYETFQTITL